VLLGQTAVVVDDDAAAKAELRAAITARRQDLTDASRDAAGDAIAATGLAQWSGCDTVAAYLSFGTEPPTWQLVGQLQREGVRVIVPVVKGADLGWAEFTDADAVRPGRLGAPEPTGPQLGPDALRRAEVVVVPALAVDRTGVRLGRGRGYYDRALTRATGRIVAVIYDDELMPRLPCEPHDRLVDEVLRPCGLSRCS
jgi:5-formyltetrahydrofolate cyclo-ligase